MRIHLGRLAAALLCLSCDPTVANGTALFVPVQWQPPLSVEQLRFAGEQNGTAAFPTTLRPDAPDAQLSSPQSVRVLLEDSLAGQLVKVNVDGLNASGGVVARGSGFATVVLGHEVKLDPIELTAAGGGGAGGGSASGGGSAAGGGTGATGGGSGAMGGGVQSCSCTGGCCAVGQTGCDKGNGAFFTCGQGSSCMPGTSGTCGMSNTCNSKVCNLLSANTCGPQGCQCFNGPACAPGLTCTSIGPFAGCLCTALTCAGCCGADGGCITQTTARECGAAGAQCVSCDGGLGGGCSAGTCALLAPLKCDAGTCLSGKECVNQGFPRCMTPISTACYYCDPILSDRCGVTGGCQCGPAAACSGDTTCVKVPDAGFKCLQHTTGG